MHRMVALVICGWGLSGDALADPVPPDTSAVVLERQATAQRRFRLVVGVGCLVFGGATFGLGYYGATHSEDGIAEIDRIFKYISYGNLVVGSAFAIAGTVLLIRKSPQERLRDKTQVTPLIAPTRGGGVFGIATQF